MNEEDPLSRLEGRKLDGYTLRLGRSSAGRFVEERNLELFLKSHRDELSKSPVVSGKYFSGRGRFYGPWVEFYYAPVVRFPSSREVVLAEEEVDVRLFESISETLPPGGRMFIVYIGHGETEEGLRKGVPPPVTPIGYLLWRAGCVWFKDWYFVEGFWEGI